MIRFPLGRSRLTASQREALSRCEGFSVVTSRGEVGIVDEVRRAENGDRPVELAVRSRAVASRELALIGIEDVYRVSPADRLIMVRGRTAQLHHRVIASALFGATAASFLGPFITVTLDRRTARATGLDLVSDSPVLSGTYLHDAYVGDVEQLAGQGQTSAVVALAIAAGGILVGWGSTRRILIAALVVAVAGLVAMWAVWQSTSPSGTELSTVERRYGYWLTATLFFASGAWAIRGLWAIRQR